MRNFTSANNCIFYKIAKANQISNKFLGQKVALLNITPVQALVLAFLGDEDQVTSTELGRKTELDSATLTGILDRLAAAEIIERKGNPDDRRSILVHLTEKGRKMADESIKLIADANREFLSALTEEEKKELHRLIDKIRLQSVR
ncbi:MAG: MarR family transcriptional regulator [Syntrophales bacterium]|nr:MarR family transcriptional regulator [Syntrophales bacterium]